MYNENGKRDCTFSEGEYFMRKMISVLLVVALLISCSNLFIFANAAEIDDSATVQPCEFMSLTKTAVLQYGVNTVTCTIPYIISTDLSNASTFRISSYGSPSYVSKTGWYAVESGSLTITNAQFYDNYQKLVLTISYNASIGAGYETYTGTTTITVANYSG